MKIGESVLYRTCLGGTRRYQYSDIEKAIFNAAEEFNVDPTMIASVIASEQNHNINIFDLGDVPLAYIGIDTSVGYGQVKVSTAELLENLDYIESSKNRFDRINRLMDTQTNIRYTAAYLAYMRDTWINDYPSIEKDIAVWGTLYNLGKTSSHSNPQPNEFGLWCVDEYRILKPLYGERR